MQERFPIKYRLGNTFTEQYTNLHRAKISDVSVSSVPHDYIVYYYVYLRGKDKFETINHPSDKHTYTNGDWLSDTSRTDKYDGIKQFNDIVKVVIEMRYKGEDRDDSIKLGSDIIFNYPE